MTEAIFFDLWNTILYTPTKNRVGEIIELLGLKDKATFHDVIKKMDETTFIDSDYKIERFFTELCSDYNTQCSSEQADRGAIQGLAPSGDPGR